MKNLRKLRKEKELTMKQLGEIFLVGESTISMWETGNREPDHKTLKNLASYFKVSTDYLLGLTDNPDFTTPDSIDVKVNPGDTFTELDKLPEDIQRQIIDYYNYHVEKHRKEKIEHSKSDKK